MVRTAQGPITEAPTAMTGWTDRELTDTLAEAMRDSHFNPSAQGLIDRQYIVDEIRVRHLTNAPIAPLEIPGGLNLVAQEVPNARPENPGRLPGESS